MRFMPTPGAVPPEFVHFEFSQTQIPAPPPEASHIPDWPRRPQRTQTHPPDCGTGHGKVRPVKEPVRFTEIVSYSGLCCHLEEYIGLDDNKYIGDLLAKFKAAKDRSKGEILHCKLTFKKKLFRESDEAVTDPMFVQLSYVQLQHDYILGNYPVGRDDAAQLSALQILVEIGFVDTPESCTLATTTSENCLLIKEEVRKVLSKAKAAGVLRLVFHDAGTFDMDENSGGTNGSIVYELERPENAVSWADMIAVAGAEAVSLCGGPTIPVPLGRLDSIEPDPEGKLPQESLDAPGLKQSFQRKGLS
ncbi:kinesin-like protein kin-14e [Quercus suber]|uniref:Kinesin-like protein kin-14e n=1 Tax=Quercus suber TaxID=58331 RepID=A0AAW0J5C7_QUESU